MITYVIPTRDRHADIAETVRRVRALGDHAAIGGAEIVVADNASRTPVRLDASGAVPVRIIALQGNIAAAARNVAAEQADPRSEWLVMLDDDSHPLDDGFIRALQTAPDNAAVLSADITLPDGSRERGGLPEVPIGCGMAVRAAVFRELGGYDPAFGYYVEESDLAARLLARGWSVVFTPAFRVLHRKVPANRDFGAILFRLVRNNGWLLRRYAPDGVLAHAMATMLERYAAIARTECVEASFNEARRALEATIDNQPRMPLPRDRWDRFTGFAHARAALPTVSDGESRTAAIIEPGKHVEEVERAIAAAGSTLIDDTSAADRLVIGTLSPGPMLDAMARLGGDPCVHAPWSIAERFRPSADRTRRTRRAG